MTYLDNAATTPVLPEVKAALIAALGDEYGNASSLHLAGRNSRTLMDEARANLMKALGDSSQGEVIFTSGGTESDNMAVFGAAKLNAKRVGKHIVTTSVEHDAVRMAVKRLESDGFEVTWITPGKTGGISAEQITDAVRDDTALVSVMSVCNETGNIYPIAEIADEIKRRKLGALLHTDAVQGFMKIPLNVKHLGADLVTVSAHKIGGVKGCGALWLRLGIALPPLLHGGGQEKGLRSGTESVPLISAFGKAAVYSGFISGAMKDALLDGLGNLDAVILGTPEAPHIAAFALPGIPAEALMSYLDSKGICISRGSACKRGRRSHVWDAFELPRKISDSAVRVSFGWQNTLEDVEVLLAALQDAKTKIRART
ncbi:MAG: cysteine desulfurase [Oscillospiraceae bacterium]|jgi:cysteine desulfurase|nr:cysteine desulfurase [Oscillospiraceae bacterium]